MGGTPYRAPDALPSDPPPTTAERLGALRSEHRAGRDLARTGVLGAAVAGIVASTGAVAGGLLGAALSLPVGAAMAAVLIVPGWRARHTVVELHEGGVVVVAKGKRRAVVFADVDALYFEVERRGNTTAPTAHVHTIRLELHEAAGGGAHRIPLLGDRADVLASALLRECSSRLLAEARRAPSLTFGRVEMDAEGITVGSDRTAWKDLALVRIQPGRFALFRSKWSPLPWRTIDIDEVPHPTVFSTLLTERAPRVEKDEGFFVTP